MPQAALHTTLPLVTEADRAGILAAYHVLSYLATSVPAVAAGPLPVRFGLLTTTTLFGTVVLALGATALAPGPAHAETRTATARPTPGT
ncbi:hypothetical protein [Streptomyces sp. NBC_00102]|uniref:hypothetical protein n=1 Tax=Streptomyces sp. NBC_00102 TaxID=2975652 RepID=UPI002255E433|nr:hypothetical protein [Streptomyces sp. NBC_00102]MCX5401979.1 hypothetical protein [Streptomyces sp. NBC_00102]